MAKIKGGPPSTHTTTAAGTDNDPTDPRILSFSRAMRPVTVFNNTGGGRAILVKINRPDDDFDNDSDDDGLGHLSIADGKWEDVSLNGQVNVQTVSFITLHNDDDLDLVFVGGWD